MLEFAKILMLVSIFNLNFIGAYHCRIGYGNDKKPRLIFRNLIAKLRGKKVF